MSDVLITPLMSLPNPVPGSDPGPDYADNLYNALNILDGHNHSVGSGNQIGPSGLLINADLPFGSNNATLLRSVRFTPQVAPISGASDLGCLYESGVDLYYNDGNGNQVRITSGGSVNATSSGISSGTATASFSGGVLIVDSNTNTPANIQCGSLLIGTNTVSPNFVTLSSPNALAANYSLLLPTALPGAQSFTTIDASGNIATGVAYSGGLTHSNLSSSAGILKGQVQAVGQVVSPSSSLFTTGSTTDVTVITTATLTTAGKPVMVVLQGDGSGTSELAAFTQAATFTITRDISGSPTNLSFFVASANVAYPPSVILMDQSVGAGTHTWTLQAHVISGGTAAVTRCILVAYELC